MLEFMALEVTGVCKFLVTNLTLVRCLGRVGHLVAVQPGATGERLEAYVALEHLCV